MSIISFKQRLKVYLRDQFACVYCQNAMNPLSDDLTLDHVIPNGLISDDNLVTCCKECNQSKGRMSSEKYMEKILSRREEELVGSSSINATERNRQIRAILKSVANKHGIVYSKLRKKGRKRKQIIAKREAVKELRAYGLKLHEIAHIFNYKDHTTVMHLLKHS